MPDTHSRDVIFATDANGQSLISEKSVPGRGRGLVASGKDFDTPRETVIWIRTPFLVILESAGLYRTCYQCFRNQTDAPTDDDDTGSTGIERVVLKTCTGCLTVKYCSKSCQSRSWREVHKLECKVFRGLHPRVLPSMVRGVVRLLKLRANGYIEERQWQDFLSLESHEEDLLSPSHGGGSDERPGDIYLMAKAAQKYSGTKEPLALVSRIFCILTINSITLMDETLEPVGFALDPVASMLNHSCEPNCVVRFDGEVVPTVKSNPILGSISIDVLRPIKDGEELTLTYIDNVMPRARRQADLATRYFFTCTCSRCSRGDQTPFDQILTATESAEACEAESYATEVLRDTESLSQKHTQSLISLIPKMSTALGRLARSGTFPLHHYPGAQLRVPLLVALNEAGRWREATLQSSIIVYRIDPVSYADMPHHPSRMLHTWGLYRLVKHLYFCSLDHSPSSAAVDDRKVFLGKTKEEEVSLLEMTMVVTISSLKFPPRPQLGDNSGSRILPLSLLDSKLSQAFTEMEEYATALQASGSNVRPRTNGMTPLYHCLLEWKRDKKGLEARLATKWDDVIEVALRREKAVGA